MMRKWLFSLVGLLIVGLLGYSGLGFYVLQASSTDTNASCAIGDSGTRIPQFACRWYLEHQLTSAKANGDAQSVLHLAIGAYPTDPEQAQKIMELALSEGAQINGFSPVTGYPPLHEAVLLNEPRLAEFLLQRGADPEIEDQNKGMTARELLSAIEERNPEKDLSRMVTLLQEKRE
ncbi:ankyrin repeat domain-containing protein [Vreelandella utahensis]|uniref:ankyrin repeat domain-containing protein n=1 Tax=Vreelandella halophila TaxID=86177 RepID=UPI0009875056|nr:ankyrin repeat domain-containing protein [Halomonas utahensis]